MTTVHALSDEAFLALFDLAAVSDSLAKEDIEGAKTALLERYRARTNLNWPSPPVMITDISLDLAELDAQGLIDQADAMLNYRFAPNALPPKVRPDGMLDWQTNPGRDQEWHWTLNRQAWWAVLSLAYRQSGDERYAQAFVKQMMDWVKNHPPIPFKDEQDSHWRLMDVGVRMRVSWIPAFGAFYESPAFTNEAKLTMLRAIYDHACFLFQFQTNRNHLLRESNGLAWISLYFPEFKESPIWQEAALARIDNELTSQVNQDGSQIEVSTGYQWLVVDEFEKIYELLHTHRLSLPTQNLETRLANMVQVLAHLVRPDGTFPEINDGFLHWPHTRLARAGDLLDRDDFRFIGTNGERGQPPQDTGCAFPDAGFYIMRTDWSKDARYLLFDCGPYGGPHGHEDKLSIEVYAYGQPFIVDSGSYSYDAKDPYRAYFVGSEGHNTILVDHCSQVRRWRKANLHPEPGPGPAATWISEPAFDYVAASYDEGYGAFSLRKPKDAYLITNVIHARHILFVKPDYWLIVDQLQADETHNFQLLFHAPPDVTVSIDAGNRVRLTAASNRARLYLIPAEPQAVTVRSVTGSQEPIQGWYSAGYHHKTPAPAIIFENNKSNTTVMTTLLYPDWNGISADQVRLEPLEVSSRNGFAFSVTTPNGKDFLMVSTDKGMKQFGDYQSSGVIAGVRLDKDGQQVRQFEG